MSDDDKETTKESRDKWLIYHEELQVLVCRVHGYAVTNLSSHLRVQHPDLSSRTRKEIADGYQHLGLQPPAKDHLRHGPSNPRAPIEGLPIHVAYVCDRCDMLTPSWKCWRVHRNTQHGRKGRRGRREPKATSVRAQTLFTRPASAVHYFCIRTAETGEEPEEGEQALQVAAGRDTPGNKDEEDNEAGLIAKIRQRWDQDREEQERQQTVVAAGALKHETTNWLKRTEWTAHFERRDLAMIYKASRMPGPEDDELLRLVAATDRMFLNRCIAGLREMPIMTRLLLASPTPHDARSVPFGPLQEKSSMDRYVGYWKRFLCYCMRVLPLAQSALGEEHGFQFTAEQRASLERLWDHLGDEDWPEGDLEAEVLQLSASFWMHKVPKNPFDSPVWHFVAVLGIDSETWQLRMAHHFTYVLAGLIYVARAVLAEWAIPTSLRGEMDDMPERFEKVRNAWLCKATYTPMGHALSLFLYGKHLAQQTGSRVMVSWSTDGELMYFLGRPVTMPAIRTMVQDIIRDAEDLLWGKLMFKEGDDMRFAIPLASIEDDMTSTHRGKSFIHTNGLAGKETEMLHDIVHGSRKGELLDKAGEWRWPAIRGYLRRVRHFEELMLVATQMTWGAPARGDEVGGLRIVNGVNRDRSVFIVGGEMVLVTQYHKSLAHFDAPKVIPRFLPHQVAQLMAVYLIYVRPLVDRWEADRWALYDKMKPPSDFIWHDENGPWEGTKVSAAISKWTEYYMGTRLTMQDWRHISIAISKRHARQHGLVKYDFEDDGGEDEDEQYEIPDDLAAAHTTATSLHYGVTVDILKRLTADSLEIFGRVSHRWHEFLRLDRPRARGPQQAPKRKGGGRPGPDTATKRPRVMCLEKASPDAGAVPDPLILDALRAVLRDEQATFRSPEQKEAICRAVAKDSPLVAILPTGGGKSLIFMVPAMLSGTGVTIVVAPFARLKEQLVTRCIDAGLDCKMWPEARDHHPRVVIVSAEAASTSDAFMQWAADIAVQGRLDRVVIDECHLSFTAALEYRPKLQRLVRLRSLGCPFVFLTGTLPRLSQWEFEEAMQLQHTSVLYIRASSHRPMTRYSVKRVSNGEGPREVKRLAEAKIRQLAPGEKGIVYCAERSRCRAVARLMECHHYHAESDDVESRVLAEREEGFQAWLRGDTPFIVATSALGTGIDIPGVLYVIHLDLPHSIINYAQEAGRAGRAGEEVEAVMVVEDRLWPAEDPKADAKVELKTQEVYSLVCTEGCRRRVLGQCLDGDIRDCGSIAGAIACDNCHQASLVWKSELSGQGIIASAAYGRRKARGLDQIERALDEIADLGKQCCRVCWMSEGARSAEHSWYTCDRLPEALGFHECMMFQRKIDYRRDPHAKLLSCFYCHVSQELCSQGFENQGRSCRWKQIVIPVALGACYNGELWARVQEVAGKQMDNMKEYAEWLGQKHRRLVCGQTMTNAMAVFKLVLDWRVEHNIR